MRWADDGRGEEWGRFALINREAHADTGEPCLVTADGWLPRARDASETTRSRLCLRWQVTLHPSWTAYILDAVTTAVISASGTRSPAVVAGDATSDGRQCEGERQ